MTRQHKFRERPKSLKKRARAYLDDESVEEYRDAIKRNAADTPIA